MTAHAQRSLHANGLTIRIPLTFQRRRGRKRLVAPDGTEPWRPQPTGDITPLVKAIARAHRWKTMLESGTYASVSELAKAEKVNESYMCRLLRLTLFAPDIIEAVVGSNQSIELPLERAIKPLPTNWQDQRCHVRHAISAFKLERTISLSASSSASETGLA